MSLENWSRSGECDSLKPASVKVTALVGSGVSIWVPTDIPTGQAFADGVLSALFGPGFRSDKVLAKVLSQAPFEVVLESCPNPGLLTELMKGLFNKTVENPIHVALAEALQDGVLHHIVTTNYDCGLDQALRAVPGVTRVVTQSDYHRWESRLDSCYFKIHGSADDQAGETMVIQLSQEGALPSWKRELLTTLVAKEILLVIGYSGLDFEICPELDRIAPSSIFWNLRSSGSISHNAATVLDRPQAKVVEGDMRELLECLGYSTGAVIGHPSIDVEGLFITTFSQVERGLWAFRLLNLASYPKRAQQECERLDSLLKSSPIDPDIELATTVERARMLFHQGAYKEAANAYQKLGEDAKTPQAKVDFLLDASDVWSEYGDSNRYTSAADSAKRILGSIPDTDVRQILEAKIKLKRLLTFTRSLSLKAKSLLPIWRRQFYEEAKDLVSTSAPVFLKAGRWYDFQQVSLWAERLGLSRELTGLAGPYEAPPPEEGYVHLNYIVAQIMNFRDMVRKKHPLVITGQARQDIKGWIQVADELGSHPESWKLRALLFRRLGLLALPWRVTDWINMWRHFTRCQYSPSRTVIQALRGWIQ